MRRVRNTGEERRKNRRREMGCGGKEFGKKAVPQILQWLLTLLRKKHVEATAVMKRAAKTVRSEVFKLEKKVREKQEALDV